MNELLNKIIDDAREELLCNVSTSEEKQWHSDCVLLKMELRDEDHRKMLDKLDDDAGGMLRAYFNAGFYAGLEFAKVARARFE